MKIRLFGTGKKVGNSIILKNKKKRVALDYGCKRLQLEKIESLPPKVDSAIITHAHFDHCGALSFKKPKKVYSTKLTRGLCRLRLDSFNKLDWEGVRYRRPFEANGFDFELFDAGHCLGSAMIEVDNGVLTYTGDLNIRDRFLWKGARATDLQKNPDCLIIDSAGAETRSYKPFQKTLDDLETIVDKAVENDDRIVMLTDRLYAFETLHHLDHFLDGRENIHVEPFLKDFMGFCYSGVGRKKPRTRFFKGFDDETRVVILTNKFQTEQVIQPLIHEKGVRIILPYTWGPRDKYLKRFKEQSRKPFSERENNDFMGYLHQLDWEIHSSSNEIESFVEELSPDKTFLIHGEDVAMKKLSQRLDKNGFNAEVGLNHSVLNI